MSQKNYRTSKQTNKQSQVNNDHRKQAQKPLPAITKGYTNNITITTNNFYHTETYFLVLPAVSG